MLFKINISHKGKTLKIETENEVAVGKKIGEGVKGGDVSDELEGYDLLITGSSDISGFPGKKDLEGAGYHRELLTYGFGMKNTKKGLRKRKTLRGEEISLKTSQINMKVVKEGSKKFEELVSKKVVKAEGEGEKAEEVKEEKVEEKAGQ